MLTEGALRNNVLNARQHETRSSSTVAGCGQIRSGDASGHKRWPVRGNPEPSAGRATSSLKVNRSTGRRSRGPIPLPIREKIEAEQQRTKRKKVLEAGGLFCFWPLNVTKDVGIDNQCVVVPAVRVTPGRFVVLSVRSRRFDAYSSGRNVLEKVLTTLWRMKEGEAMWQPLGEQVSRRHRPRSKVSQL